MLHILRIFYLLLESKCSMSGIQSSGRGIKTVYIVRYTEYSVPVQNVKHITDLILADSGDIRVIPDNWRNKGSNDKKNPDKILKDVTSYTN